MKFLKEPLFWVSYYLFMILFTFGHAYVGFPSGYKSPWSDVFITYGIFEKCIGSFFAAVGWPFYWSVKLWS